MLTSSNCINHLRAISQEVLMNLIRNMCSETTHLKVLPYLPMMQIIEYLYMYPGSIYQAVRRLIASSRDVSKTQHICWRDSAALEFYRLLGSTAVETSVKLHPSQFVVASRSRTEISYAWIERLRGYYIYVKWCSCGWCWFLCGDFSNMPRRFVLIHELPYINLTWKPLNLPIQYCHWACMFGRTTGVHS